MPKTETIDRIQIIAEAPSLEVVGAGLAALTRLGFENVGFKLVTDILQYKHNQPNDTKKVKRQRPQGRTVRSGSSATVVRVSNRKVVEQIIESRQDIFTTAEIQEFFKASGRNPNSVSPILYKMTQAAMLEHVGSGQYQRTTKAMNGWALNNG